MMVVATIPMAADWYNGFRKPWVFAALALAASSLSAVYLGGLEAFLVGVLPVFTMLALLVR